MRSQLTLGQYTELLKQNTDYMITAVVSACILSDKLRVGRVTYNGIYLQDQDYPKLDEVAATALFYYSACVKSHVESRAYTINDALDTCIDMTAITYLLADCSNEDGRLLKLLTKTIEHYHKIEDHAAQTGFDYTTSILCAVMHKITRKHDNKIDGYDCSRKNHTRIIQEFKKRVLEELTGGEAKT